jgi:hypothetical protein
MFFQVKGMTGKRCLVLVTRNHHENHRLRAANLQVWHLAGKDLSVDLVASGVEPLDIGVTFGYRQGKELALPDEDALPRHVESFERCLC